MVAGNWKMHGSKEMVTELLGGLLSGLEGCGDADVVVFPEAFVPGDGAKQMLGSRYDIAQDEAFVEAFRRNYGL